MEALLADMEAAMARLEGMLAGVAERLGPTAGVRYDETDRIQKDKQAPSAEKLRAYQEESGNVLMFELEL